MPCVVLELGSNPSPPCLRRAFQRFGASVGLDVRVEPHDTEPGLPRARLLEFLVRTLNAIEQDDDGFRIELVTDWRWLGITRGVPSVVIVRHDQLITLVHGEVHMLKHYFQDCHPDALYSVWREKRLLREGYERSSLFVDFLDLLEVGLAHPRPWQSEPMRRLREVAASLRDCIHGLLNATSEEEALALAADCERLRQLHRDAGKCFLHDAKELIAFLESGFIPRISSNGLMINDS